MVASRELEVWDYDLKNMIKSGHVYNNELLFDQLCKFVPFEDWYEVFLRQPVKPGRYKFWMMILLLSSFHLHGTF